MMERASGLVGVQGISCDDCGVAIATEDQSAGETRCLRCSDLFLRRSDAAFLDSYARLGARGRLVVAEACLRQLVLSDTGDRKLLAMSVYEQFVAAATDLIGLYHALDNRREAPIIKGILGFKLDVPRALAFFEELLSRGPTAFIGALGLPHPEQVRLLASDLDARERRQVWAALTETLADLDRLVAFQEIGERALVSAATQLRGPVALADQTAWLPHPAEASQVAALAMDRDGRHVEVNLLNTDEDTLGAVVDGIDTMTRLTRNIIFAFVSLHAPVDFRSGFPEA
ncbi:MAG: hypothetical protein ACYDCQ_18635 [Dehalococcoidia bacterium]